MLMTDKCGRNMKAIRIARDITQDEISHKAFICKDHYKRIESGKSGCSMDVLQSIAAALSVSTDELRFGHAGDNLPAGNKMGRPTNKYRKQVLDVVLEGVLAGVLEGTAL